MDDTEATPLDNRRGSLERWGWASICVNLGLVGLNLAVACASGSLAVAAEMVHNTTDLVASMAVLVGLKLSKRRSSNFPYGLYKVENVVAVGISVLIFLTAYEIVKEALLADPRDIDVSPLIIGGVILSMLIPLVFSFFEMRVGRSANSPSLVADAKEFRTHVLTSGAVLISLFAYSIEFPIEQIATAIVTLVIVKTGWSLLLDSMRVLLDASLKPETLKLAREIIERAPIVVNVKSVFGRNAGRYLFLEASVEVRTHDLKKVALAIQKIEQTIYDRIPHLEKVTINPTPTNNSTLRIALPVEASAGPLSRHFGAASDFLVVEKRRSDGFTLHQTTFSNPFSDDPRGRGIKVANWIIKQNIDALVTLDNITEKGPGHVLGEAGIDLRICMEQDLVNALEESWNLLKQKANR